VVRKNWNGADHQQTFMVVEDELKVISLAASGAGGGRGSLEAG